MLLGLAVALRAFLLRLLAPWIGAPAASPAATSSALLLVLHPLAPAAIASLEARSELLGLFLGFLACALFLRGRQEERGALVSASLIVLLLSGLASRAALPVALLLAASEYLSARRHRRRSLRLRTALTTLVVFGSAAVLPGLLLGDARSSPTSDALGDAAHVGVAGAVECLGWQILPAQPGSLGTAGAVLAGGLFLLALQPVFRAARNAPRLWGGALVLWTAALLCAEVRRQAFGLPGFELDRAWAALASTVVIAIGLGLTSTAQSARRSLLLPLFVGAGYAVLAHGNARAWFRASAEVGALCRDLLVARGLGSDAWLLVVDPPERSDGVDPLGAWLPWLAHPLLDGLPTGGPRVAFDPGRVRALSRESFLALVREPEFERLRADSLVVLAPRAAQAPTPGHAAVALRPRWPASTTNFWRTELTHHFQSELDPLLVDAIRVRAEPGTPARELERLGWRGRDGTGGALSSRIVQEAGEQVAFFDASSSLEWRLAGGIRSLVLERGVRPIQLAEVLGELPRLDGVGPPEVQGPDWVFARPAADHPDVGSATSFVLVLLALDELDGRALRIESGGGVLRARGAADFAARVAARGAPLSWSLDYRIGAQTVARVRGRLP